MNVSLEPDLEPDSEKLCEHGAWLPEICPKASDTKTEC